MKVSINDVNLPLLDWLVAKCVYPDAAINTSLGVPCLISGIFNPSENWAQGGPIVEQEVTELYEHKALECWAAKSKERDLRYGPTPLIAAMRCYVSSKLGDEIEVPDEIFRALTSTNE